jgi:hypothetical protein
MDMRRLKTIAICLGLAAATLASERVSAEPAKRYDPLRTYVNSRKAFGAKAFHALPTADMEAILKCGSLQWCGDHFGGKDRTG